MLNDLKLIELLLKEIHGWVSWSLGELPSEELSCSGCLTFFEKTPEFCTNTVLRDVIHHFNGVLGGQDCSAHLKVTCRLSIKFLFSQDTLRELFVNKIFSQSSDFKLKLITSTKLILNVLRRTKAFEFSSDHDSHLGAKSFSLFHGVSGNNNGTLLL